MQIKWDNKKGDVVGILLTPRLHDQILKAQLLDIYFTLDSSRKCSGNMMCLSGATNSKRGRTALKDDAEKH
jgi:hypothetical protein